MCRCWNDEPTGRPTFADLVTWIDEVVSKAPPAGARRTGDSRLYLNIAGRTHCQPAAEVPAGTSVSSNAPEDFRVIEDVRCT